MNMEDNFYYKKNKKLFIELLQLFNDNYNNMNSKHILLIISKALRPLYDSRYYLMQVSPYNKNILKTDSLCEVKIWLDIIGLKFNKWKQYEYHFTLGTNGVQLIFMIEFVS